MLRGRQSIKNRRLFWHVKNARGRDTDITFNAKPIVRSARCVRVAHMMEADQYLRQQKHRGQQGIMHAFAATLL